jgi:hypothetical protein
MKPRNMLALAALAAANIALAQAGPGYTSTFQGYQPYADAEPGDWRKINRALAGAAAGTPASAAAAHEHGAAASGGKDVHAGHTATDGASPGADPHHMEEMHRRMHGKAMRGMQDRAGHGTPASADRKERDATADHGAHGTTGRNGGTTEKRP